jgi:acyl-CoA thioesterase-1
MKILLASLLLIIALAASACKSQKNEASSTAASAPSAADQKVQKIVAFGNSLTAGMGLTTTETYPAQLQKILEDDGFQYEVVNAGISGETTSGGLRRIDWTLDDDVKFVILELGANDFLRGTPISLMKENLSSIIETIQSRGAVVILAGMEAPTNSGPDYQKEVHEAYRELAKKYHLPFIPFFLDGVITNETLMQDDQTHPNAKGSKILAQNVYQVLKPLLSKKQS